VEAASGGNITWDFSGCSVSQRPVWLAVQDGSGPWTVVTPVANVYTFTITAKGGVTQVLGGGANSTILVQFFTKAEFGTGVVFCPAPGVLKTVNGTVAGVGATEAAHVSLGGGSAFVSMFTTIGFPNFSITSVQAGSQDLVGSHRPTLAGIADKAIIQRGLNIANGGSVGTLDFGASGFTLDNGTITVTGLTVGETQLTQAMNYQVAGCMAAPLYSGVPFSGSSFTAAGVPAADAAAGDFHGLSLFASDPTAGTTRSTSQFFHTFGDKTVAMPSVFPTPTMSTLAGSYKRVQAVYTLPADYDQSTSLTYTDEVTGSSVFMQASMAYLGGTSVTFAFADYTGLTAWDNNWAPVTANTSDWRVSGAGGNAATGFCTEGAHVDIGSVKGTI
jgi:hypothetical protein